MLKNIIPVSFILLWIVPVGWVGLMQSSYPFYPYWIAPLFRVTGIFESAPSRWRVFFIEVQDDKGWNYIDEKSLFASTPLGDRTRFQQLMAELDASKPSSPDQVPKILEWIGMRLPQAVPLYHQAKAVRIIHFGIPPETFLKCVSLSEVYKAAYDTHMPRGIDASLNLSPDFR